MKKHNLNQVYLLVCITVPVFLLHSVAIAANTVVVVPLGKSSTSVAMAAGVLEGKTFSNKDEIGISGAMVDFSDSNAKVYTPGASVVNIDTGYHAGSTLATDVYLLPQNIRAGIRISGVSGDDNVVDTSSGDAAAQDIMLGKYAWVDGYLIEGAHYAPSCSELMGCEGTPGACTFDLDRCAMRKSHSTWKDMKAQCRVYGKTMACVAYGYCQASYHQCGLFGQHP
jgi:hypothetical protein